MSSSWLHAISDVILFPHLNDHYSPPNLHSLGVIWSHRHLHPFFLDQGAKFGLIVKNVESSIIEFDESMISWDRNVSDSDLAVMASP